MRPLSATLRGLATPFQRAARVLRRRTALDATSFGNLRRTTPFSRDFGYDRGMPLDRCYIENFLARNRGDVRGRVLEIKDAAYTRRFGGTKVSRSDVLDIDNGNPRATLIDNLTVGTELPSNAFDCIVVTQTLQLIFDIGAAVAMHRILAPGGVALVTVPGLTQIPRIEANSWYWSFTSLSARRLFEPVFHEGAVTVESHGNVLVAAAFLYGLPAHQLDRTEIHADDPDYPVTIAIRAVKAGAVA